MPPFPHAPEVLTFPGVDQSIPESAQWRERTQRPFTAEERSSTTILVAGMTLAHDTFVAAALTGLGYHMQPLDCPDNEALAKAIIIGDILNAQGYRIRPYEVAAGQTDQVIAACRRRIAQSLERRRGLVRSLRWCRRQLDAIPVDRTRVKPSVSIIGEFWAMITEGDGNYRLPSYLEANGAEVQVQMVTSWMLYLLWTGRHDTRKRMQLAGEDGGRYGLDGVNPRKRLRLLAVGERLVRTYFAWYARLLGFNGYELTDMEGLAELSHDFYDNELRGGEGHMEVGKLIQNVEHKKATLTISVKPFGCMPSSGVSDGVQALVTERYPQALFLPIETTGDGAVNVYSRVQMQLARPRDVATGEWEDALRQAKLSAWDLTERFQRHRSGKTLRYPAHKVSSTAANAVYALG